MGNREHVIFFPDVFNTTEAEAGFAWTNAAAQKDLRLEQCKNLLKPGKKSPKPNSLNPGMYKSFH